MKRISTRIALLLFILVFGTASASAQDIAQKLDTAIKSYADARVFNGCVLVAKGDDVLYAKGYGLASETWDIPNTADVRFRIGSVTKQFTAAVILRMMEEGKLDLQAHISDYIPYYPKKYGSVITLHQLLTHTSGLPNFTDFPEYLEHMESGLEQDSVMALFWNKDLDFEPGSNYSYSNSGYFVLGCIIEKVGKTTYERALHHYLLDPLALVNTGCEHKDIITKRLAEGFQRTPLGYNHTRYIDMELPFAAGMMYSTVGDLYRWTRSLHTGKVFVNEDTYNMMTTAYTDNYGYGVGVRDISLGDRSVSAVMHSGGINGFTSQCWYLLEDAYTIVVLDNAMGPTARVGDAIVRVLYDLPLLPVLPSIADEVARIADAEGMTAALTQYDVLKMTEKEQWDFAERELNLLGYYYLRQDEVDAAIAVFEKNIQEYPGSSNTYDSMGEGLYKAGRYDESIAMYKKALEMDPSNTTAAPMLKKMGVEVEAKELKLDEDLLQSFVGKYELQPGFVIDITREGTQLFLQATGQQRFEIYPSKTNEFYLKVVEARITFNGDGIAPAESLVLHQNGRDMPAQRMD